MSEDCNVLRYAIVADDQPLPTAMTGVADEPVKAIAGPGVAAVAGLVPRADFDAEPLQAHLDDVAWLERVARTHHEVIDALVRYGPCLPMRLATLYRDERRVEDLLQARCGEFLSALARIAGRSEWGVKVHLAQMSAVAATAPDGELSADDERPGTAYLLRRKTQNERRHQVLQDAAAEAQQIHASLANVAEAATQHATQSAEASGRSEPMVLNGAYLVDDTRTSVFDEAVAALAAHHPELRLEVTGPWPAYSFSGVGPEPEEG